MTKELVPAGTAVVTSGYGRGIMERNTKILRVDQGFYHYGSTGDGNSIAIDGLKGEHDGGDGDAVLTDTGAAWGTNQWVGFKLLNVTDGSSTTVTSNTATTITGVLSGGTQNDWDISEVYHIQGNDFKKSTLASLTLFNQGGVDRIIIQNAGGNTSDIQRGNLYYAVDEDSPALLVLDPDMPGNTGTPMIRGAVSLNGKLFVADIK